MMGFFLTREEQKFSSSLNAEYKYTGHFLAQFTVGPVIPSERWRFKCYGYYMSNRQLWSEPSDTLELLVSGEEAPDSLLNDIDQAVSQESSGV